MVLEDDFELDTKNIFGMNKYEFRVWRIFMEQGMMNISDLQLISDIPRTRCYDVIESLLNKKFLLIVDITEKKQRFKINNPEIILNTLKKNILLKSQEEINKIEEFRKSKCFDMIKWEFDDVNR